MPDRHREMRLEVDNVSRRRRSAIMANIRSKNTMPELVVRKLISAMGLRYRLHVASLPGRPDLVFRRDRKIVFVHGCFWHQHTRCKVARMPKSRLAYWAPKLERNRDRDLRNVRRLRSDGWSVLTIRECQLRDAERVKERIDRFFAYPLTPETTRSDQRQRTH
jgi:DNA mismatch endonuclease (patch repair protein)